MHTDVSGARQKPPLRPQGGRVPPHDLASEAAVLSACLLDRETIDTVRAIIGPEHCYADAHRRILEAIYVLDDLSQPVDLVSVASKLKETNHLEQAGGSAYLAEISDATPAVAHVDHHAKTVRDLWCLRQAISLHQEKSAEAFVGISTNVQEWIEKTEHELALLAGIGHDSELEQVGEIATRYYGQLAAASERGQTILGTPTGYIDLDERTGGLFDGDLIIVAGRPGLGKTSLATCIARNVAKEDLGVAVFSLEMPREQLGMRMMCAEELLDANLVRRGKLQADDWRRLSSASNALAQLPIWIDDKPMMTVQEIRAKVRRLQRRIASGDTRAPCKKLGLVALDYLQLMKGIRERGDTREREVASISQGLKNLAKSLQVPVLALSQLNRSVERKGSDKRPQMSDLRESGAIEQDADAIWLLYRDNYYNKESASGNEVELDIAKQRNGPTGVVRLSFMEKYMRYYNAETRDDYGEMTGAKEWDADV